ncbi:DNA binding protein [Bacillus phage AR9]|uniref:DNA binding protein n=2 Tax=Bacillus phage PBS1 TaxID=10683 RepID=A0A172JI55_BPPB1|nr:sigma factor [Bacillus phage AR9]YP_009664239.1 sigma factor [Bacillus phage PBS1]QXN70072.1 putative DNA binding protein [Bacillus phage vB_BspM_Internexus]WCS68272.1 hypothetical protein Goe21_01620 [Bacillus phage vB_BsuM-Goe21]AMS01233.1 DNA binding protein [Bacillus phage AR9]AST99859.1 hypothetical protein PBI_PBS1_37 [Bacillus phage PBS1]BDE75321.1 hypothetical protein [Bacillus phage PBS1]
MGRENGQYNIEEAKRLIGETDLSYSDISKKTGVKYQTVQYHGSKIRGKRPRKESMHGEVITRKMTPEEEIRYGVRKPLNYTEEKDNVKGITPTHIVNESLNKPIEKKFDSGSISLNIQDINIDNIDEQFERIKNTIKSFGIKEISVTIESYNH